MLATLAHIVDKCLRLGAARASCTLNRGLTKMDGATLSPGVTLLPTGHPTNTKNIGRTRGALQSAELEDLRAKRS
jgi:hypothetical protein